jgi:RHS (Retrotransposon Hot Spot) family protein
MEVSDEKNESWSHHYEHLVPRRNTPSVSLLISSLHSVIHHLVPHSAAMHGFTNEQWNLAEGYFKNFGPIPRFCINFVKNPAGRVDHEHHCQIMISRLTSDRLRESVLSGGDLDLDGFSHTIIMVRRNEMDDLEEAHVEPISAIVETKIMTTINEMQLLNRIDLYHTFASISATKVVAGLAYESLCHTRLQEGIRLTLKPMIRRQERKLYHWKSLGKGQASNSMEVDSEITEFFPSNIAVTYGSEMSSVAPNRLYVPKSRTQVALDSFFQLDAMLHIFQFTMASSHDIKERIEKSLSGLLNILPPKTNWRFVFITPPGCEVDVTVASKAEKFLEGVTLYSAHLEIESRMNFAAPLEPE